MESSDLVRDKEIGVSVVMPVFNVDKFLGEAIESVLNQTFEDFELILVNDGSTDSSAAICKRYLDLHARVRFFDQPNLGVSAARNRGMGNAEGKYIYFMDSDDTIDKDFLRNSYCIGEKSDADIVVLGEYYINRLPDPPALPGWAMLIRRNFIKDNPMVCFPNDIQPCEDGLFSHQLLALTNRIGSTADALYFYRKHDEQNHQAINKQADKLLKQIPQWFAVLDNFYTHYNLYQNKSLHLARFLEHEPFEFRYLGMPLNLEQKEYLFHTIHEYFDGHVNPYLPAMDFKKLSVPFQLFLQSKSCTEFDDKYQEYSGKIAVRRKIMLFLVKLIPFSSQRRGLRKKLNARLR